MAIPRGSSSIYLLPGMVAKIKAPKYYVAHGSRKVMNLNGDYEDRELINGFALQDYDIGALGPVDSEPAILYTHKKFGLNKIFFYARTGETSFVDIIAVPIHDHSSIVSGGPAFGTYFSDDETL